MTSITHLLRHDLRRFRVAIGAWVLLSALIAIVKATLPRLAPEGAQYQVAIMADTLLWLSFALLGAILIAAIVQAHSPVGTTAFWLTRPIDPRRLLAAKVALVIAALVGVPVTGELISMVAHRIPLSMVALVTLELLFLGTVIALVLMALAAVTSTVPRFAVLCAGVAVAAAIAVALYIAAMRRAPDEEVFVLVSASSASFWRSAATVSDNTKPIVGLLLAIAAALALLWIQYRRRVRLWAAAAGVAGTVAALAVALVWPWPLFVPQPVAADWANREGALVLTPEPLSLHLDDLDFGETRRWTVGRGRAHLAGVADGWLATTNLMRATFETNGEIVEGRGSIQPSMLPTEPYGASPAYDVLRRVLDVDTIRGDSERGSLDATFFALRGADRRRVEGKYGNYRGEFGISLTRVERIAALPLDPGATFQDGALRLTIDRLRLSGTTLNVRVRIAEGLSIFDRAPRPEYSFYLRNRRTREAMASPNTGFFFRRMTHWPGGMLLSRESGFSLRAEWLHFSANSLFSSGELPEFAAEREWLNDSELVIVRALHGAPVRRVVEMRGVTFSRAPDRR